MSYNLEDGEYHPSGEVDSVEDHQESLKDEFLTYLDGKIAPLFAAESLSYILGSEPVAHFEPGQVADFVAGWAQMCAVNQSKPVYVFYLKSVELIVTADHTGVITGFKPSAFYMPYFEALADRCPPEDRELFLAKLKQLREMLVKQWSYDFRRDNYMHTVKIKSDGLKRREPQDEIKYIISRMQLDGQNYTPTEEQAVIADLKRVIEQLIRKPGFVLTPHLEALIAIAIDRFNSGKTIFGTELIHVVQQTYSWSGFDEATREWLRNCKPATELNNTQIKSLVAKTEFRNALQVILKHFEDLNPYNLLNALSVEKDRQQRRLLTSLIEAHGEVVAPITMGMLSKISPQAANDKNWFFTRNLIYILGRVAPQDPGSQREALALISPYLRAPVFQLRMTALSSLENFTIEDVIQPLARVFSADNFTEQELKNRDRVSTYLNNTITLVSKLEYDSALRLLIDIVTGQCINFLPEKLARPLRLQALQALSSRREQLTPSLIAPIFERIRNMTKWRIPFLARLFGEDEEQLLVLLDIIGAVPIEETIAVLTNIKKQRAKRPAGRHAAQILNNIEVAEVRSLKSFVTTQ
jgi:hypothetical protein